MSNSVMSPRDQGPDLPLGFVKVTTPGTPVGLMSNLDAANSFAPGTASPSSSGVAQGEYTVRCQQIIFQALKPGASHGAQNNTGNIYLVRAGNGSSNRDDTGAIVATLAPGTTFVLGSAATVTDVFSPYRYSVDADNANDGVFATLLIF